MTQDSTAERRRARMAFMDDKKGTQAMTAPIIYIRQEPDTAHAGTWCDVPDGGTPYVPQAAIAAVMMGAVKIAEDYDLSVMSHTNADLRARTIAATIRASIPADAMAALAERERLAEQRGFDRAKEQAAQIIKTAYPCETGNKWAAQVRAMEGGE